MKFTLTSLTFYLVCKNHRGNKEVQKVVKTPLDPPLFDKIIGEINRGGGWGGGEE